MTSSNKGKHAPSRVQLSYQLLRNTTSPDEKSIGVQSFVANLPAFEILKLDTKDNLRGYLAAYDPRKRNRVHDAIRKTIDSVPERFIVRNSGFVVTAAGVSVDDNAKTVTLDEASLINGAQSQGEIRSFRKEISDPDSPDAADDIPFHVRAVIIVDPDHAEVVETAIARNIATPVKSITEAGARGQLNELENSIASVIEGAKIRKAESDVDVIDTRKVLQLCRLLMPTSVSGNPTAAEKLRAYKNPEQCLTDFCDWFAAKDILPESKRKYEFTVQIAPYALQEYDRWEGHPDWNGHKIWSETKKGGRAVRRNKKTKKIEWVSPAILFPLMGAMSEFCSRDKQGQWRIQKPNRFKEDEMVKRAVNQFRAHNSDPILMGRSEAAYDALRIYPQTLVEVLRDIAAEG
jgi:AIPR protein